MKDMEEKIAEIIKIEPKVDIILDMFFIKNSKEVARKILTIPELKEALEKAKRYDDMMTSKMVVGCSPKQGWLHDGRADQWVEDEKNMSCVEYCAKYKSSIKKMCREGCK